MTLQLQTKRDLYLAVNRLSEEQKKCDRPLELYLLAVLNRSAAFCKRDSLTLSELYELISSGFIFEPMFFEEAWRDQYDQLPEDENGYVGWRATIIRQIVDLREMDECGTLKNEMRSFGVTAPRNSTWFNFEPIQYIECAMAGSFDGWEPGDDTGREFVPGQVSVMAEDGSIQSVNAEDMPHSIFEISSVTWEQMKDFNYCGQIYE
tara:strand:+ start:452 stop:1069 length:618 start_codon:yes stop_codon:yes gene_type:complete